ncbi:MAG: serpin family protein [Polyangiaceae bacterium]
MKLRTLIPAALVGLTVAACGGDAPVPQTPTAPPAPPPSPVASTPVEVAPAAPTDGPMVTPKTASPASTPGNDFAMTMLRALHGEKGNVFFSGESLRAALGMTSLGAKGQTLTEMTQTLHIDPDPAKNAANEKAVLAAWKQAAGKAELVIANRLWVEARFPLDKTFLGEVQSGYGAQAIASDFVKSPEPSRVKINNWIGATTKGKIKELLPAGSIDAQTRLVLTNAVYFKGNWTTAFKKAATADEAFQTDAGAVIVPTMHRTDTMSYAENDGVQLVELPYKDSDLTMLIALPKAGQLSSIESQIDGGRVDSWAKSLSSAKVTLSLPKFTFAWGRSVKHELDALGIHLAFTDKADFSLLATSKAEPLMVSDVVHKGFVLVDETGTEAAAATGVVMTTKAVALEKLVVLKVDHPFLFFVRNGKTGEILFTGRVANPKG